MIRAVLIDDEIPALERFADMLSKIDNIKIVGKYTNPLELLNQLPEIAADVLFLDVEMPELDGITLANRIVDLKKNCEIIFVTAFNEYAVEAFEVNALDYLVKPVNFERLKKSINRINAERCKEEKSTNIEVQCFGTFKVQFTNGQAIKWRTKKTEELFAFFIDSFPEAVSRNSIIEALWEEFECDRAVTHFNTTLYNLKRAFLNNGIQDIVGNFNGFYKLNSEHICCDLWRQIEIFSKKTEITSSDIKELEEILKDSSEGGYFENSDYLWMEWKKTHLQELYIQYLIRISEFYKEKGELEKALELLRRILKTDPLNEEINMEMIKTYLCTKDRISALKTFDTYKRKLKAEFKMEPDEKFLKLLNKFSKIHIM